MNEEAFKTNARKWLESALVMACDNMRDDPKNKEYWNGYKNACVAMLWNFVYTHV
jgi:hypothetical protein